MNHDIVFQIFCTNCGCLSIRIEEPLKATREAMVYCGDCGTSRGTVGALRDLSVRQHSDTVFSTPPTASPVTELKANDAPSASGISKRYAELQRLRHQVEIAELLACESNRPAAIGRTRRNTGYVGFRASPRAEAVTWVDEQDQKRPVEIGAALAERRQSCKLAVSPPLEPLSLRYMLRG
jgi:hypothetical protein